MTKEAALKELEKFKKEYQKLVNKYPNVLVQTDVRRKLAAYHTVTYNTKVLLD